MQLEVTIKAGLAVREQILTGLARLAAAHGLTQTFARPNRTQLHLNFILETESPDTFLTELAAAAADIETCLPQGQHLDILIKNRERAEPVLGSGTSGRPFSPVNPIRIVPWPAACGVKPAAHDILLDPAGAFGSGLHPSTRLCLQLLKQAVNHDPAAEGRIRSVLDIGCGSGILAIAALRLGADRALGLEIDEPAVQAARRNVELNGLTGSIRIVKSSWQDITGPFDLVLANLVPSVLFKAAPGIAGLLNRRALLITAGFPAAQTLKVTGLFEEKGLRLQAASALDGWGGLLLKNQHDSGAII